LNGLATTYMEKKDYAKAAEYYEMWLKAEPNNADAKAGLEKAKKYTQMLDDAVSSAGAFLKLMDEAKYGDSWDDASKLAQIALTKVQWEKDASLARNMMGKNKSRKVTSSKYETSIPGAPDGEYVEIVYESSFEKKDKAVETVSMMKDPDGKWRWAGYFIK